MICFLQQAEMGVPIKELYSQLGQQGFSVLKHAQNDRQNVCALTRFWAERVTKKQKAQSED